MKEATDDVGTGNVGVLKTVAASLDQVVAQMKALREDNAKVRCCPYAQGCDLSCCRVLPRHR